MSDKRLMLVLSSTFVYSRILIYIDTCLYFCINTMWNVDLKYNVSGYINILPNLKGSFKNISIVRYTNIVLL